MKRSRLNQLIVMIFLATTAQHTFAYTMIKCGSTPTKWASKNYTVRASSAGFPTGPWRDALASVITHWNENPSNLRYGIVWNDASVAANNNENEAWWEPNNGPNVGTSPAITYLWFKSDCTLKEADVIFNSNVSYHYTTNKASLWPYGGSSRPFQTTAMHEFGHAGGLAHTANTYNIMGSDWTHIHANGATATAYSGEDANNGLVAAYGLGTGTLNDLAVSHWRHTGSSGEYSTHSRTRLLNMSNVELTKVGGTAEPVYRVNKGQTVKIELTYENLGKTSPLTAKVGFYLSNNDTISTTDRFMVEGAVTLHRGFPDTTSNAWFTIPADLVSGQNYWIGAIIDYNNVHAERSKANNATYIAIRVN